MSLKRHPTERAPGTDLATNPVRRALIADRDLMSGRLFADALVRNRSYEAAAILPSELLEGMVMRETNLVLISADLSSEPGGGFALAALLSGAYPQTRIVMLLDQVARTSVISAFRSGARGVFSRRQSMSSFLECIDYVERGGIWAGKVGSRILLEALRNIPAPVIPAADRMRALTARELQVVQRAAQGKSNRVISQELNLSEHTIKNHMFRTFEKLGVSSRIELLFYLTMIGYSFGELDAAGAGGTAPGIRKE